MSRQWSSPLVAVGASALVCLGLFSATVAILLKKEEEVNRQMAGRCLESRSSTMILETFFVQLILSLEMV
jgi:hypothetical protein